MPPCDAACGLLAAGHGSAERRRRRFRVSGEALPEASLLLANLLPTPAVVSVAFNVVTFLPQYLWLLMVFAPDWSVTRTVMRPLWPVLAFGLTHLFIVFVVASNNDSNLEDFTELAKVFDPRVSVNLLQDFSPQAAMMRLMQSPGFVSEEWSHVLVWDLFVGRWIYLDGQRRGIFASHSVLLCNLIGPPGILAHALTCLVLGKGLPAEDLETDSENDTYVRCTKEELQLVMDAIEAARVATAEAEPEASRLK